MTLVNRSPKTNYVRKGIVQKMLNKVGVQIKRYPNEDIRRRLQIIHHHRIDTLFDIGAAIGEYGLKMREAGYTKRMISFEPLPTAFAQLQKNAARDHAWTVYNYALGDQEGEAFINVAGNSDSSSLLNMLPEHINSEPNSKYISRQAIEIKTLDSIFPALCEPHTTAMLKLDVQGFEKAVLEGGQKSLKKVRIIQLEMSLVPLYENQVLFTEMTAYMETLGFRLFSLENGFASPQTGQLLQVDGIFVR